MNRKLLGQFRLRLAVSIVFALLATALLVWVFPKSSRRSPSPASSPDPSAEELIEGLQVRDGLIQSISMEFSTLSTYPDREFNGAPSDFRYVYQGHKVYMRATGEYADSDEFVVHAVFNGEHYNALHYSERVKPQWQSIGPGYISPWGNRTKIRVFYRLGLQAVEPKVGGWFARKGGELLGSRIIEGHRVYLLSDRGKDHPQSPNGVGYVVWVSPDHDFTPVRIDLYRWGVLHHVYQFVDLQPEGKGLWAPRKATVWYFAGGKKIKEFDPDEPANYLIKVDLDIGEMEYNHEYDDSFFQPRPVPQQIEGQPIS